MAEFIQAVGDLLAGLLFPESDKRSGLFWFVVALVLLCGLGVGIWMLTTDEVKIWGEN